MGENGTENGVNGVSAEKRKAEDAASNGDSGAKKEKLEGGTLLFAGATDWKLVGRKGGELRGRGKQEKGEHDQTLFPFATFWPAKFRVRPRCTAAKKRNLIILPWVGCSQ